jgi:hypothetical protein
MCDTVSIQNSVKPQRCKSGRASEARHQGRRRSFLLRALDNVASEVLLLSRRAKNIVKIQLISNTQLVMSKILENIKSTY